MDVALIHIVRRVAIPTDVLDALPPERALLLVGVSDEASLPGGEYSAAQVRAAVARVGGGAGPGWLTGREHNTCRECGRTSWRLDVDEHQGWCTQRP